MIPLSEWRKEADRDMRSISTAIEILRAQNEEIDPGAGGPEKKVLYSG